jgi:predicted ATPase
LQEDDSNISANFFPKNGSKKLEDVSVHLKRRGIAFPAKYEVWFNEAESFWQEITLKTQLYRRRESGSFQRRNNGTAQKTYQCNIALFERSTHGG